MIYEGIFLFLSVFVFLGLTYTLFKFTNNLHIGLLYSSDSSISCIIVNIGSSMLLAA